MLVIVDRKLIIVLKTAGFTGIDDPYEPPLKCEVCTSADPSRIIIIVVVVVVRRSLTLKKNYIIVCCAD